VKDEAKDEPKECSRISRWLAGTEYKKKKGQTLKEEGGCRVEDKEEG